jgi:hypothetical protein
MMINKIDKSLEENAVNQKKFGIEFESLQDKLKDMKEPTPTQLGYLGLMNGGYNQYAGTVDPEIVRRRRAKNKRSRQARRSNRARGK